MRRLSLAHALLACVVAPVAAQHASDTATSDTALTVQGFLQRDDQFDLWTIVVPLHVQALGVRTFVVPLVGKADRWSWFVSRYIEATGRLSRLPSGGVPGVGFAVEKMQEVEPPGAAHRTFDRGLTLHAKITAAVIPNRFAWSDAEGNPTGVNPTVLYTILNQRQAPIIFLLQNNDLLCLTVRNAASGGEWHHATQVPSPAAQRFVVTHAGHYRDVLQVPQDAAPTRGRYTARVGICQVDDYDITTEFEVR